jgi:hypothetical protein
MKPEKLQARLAALREYREDKEVARSLGSKVMEQKSPQKDETSEQQSLDAVVKEALSSDRVPHIYANGFIYAIGNVDVTVILQRNGIPNAVLNMSYSMTKTLYQKLGDAVSKFEKKTQHNIMTPDEIDRAIAEASGDSK